MRHGAALVRLPSLCHTNPSAHPTPLSCHPRWRVPAPPFAQDVRSYSYGEATVKQLQGAVTWEAFSAKPPKRGVRVHCPALEAALKEKQVPRFTHAEMAKFGLHNLNSHTYAKGPTRNGFCYYRPIDAKTLDGVLGGTVVARRMGLARTKATAKDELEHFKKVNHSERTDVVQRRVTSYLDTLDACEFRQYLTGSLNEVVEQQLDAMCADGEVAADLCPDLMPYACLRTAPMQR